MMTWPARSSPQNTRKPVYVVHSPPNTDVDKISTGSGFSPFGSPLNDQGQVSHFQHHSVAESSSYPRSSGPLRNEYSSVQDHDLDRRTREDENYDEMDGPDEKRRRITRFYSCLLFTLVLAFTLFCLILWGVSKSFAPIATLKEMVLENLNVQSGNDQSGVLTDMLTLNSTVRILYRNPATFFTVHVISAPLQLSYSQLILASGQMEEFSQRRKSERIIETKVFGDQIPLYGGVPALYGQRAEPDQVVLPLNLTFTLRARAYVLGRLVKTKFHSNIKCSITFYGDKLGKTLDLSKSCSDH
ncbi:unnamed protein product [Arabidopsis thaliana]|uniref:Late embryogenesis abundant protein LEA-2 subgroup domain-containing protein n=1 Tax=Arabidopsis thaliana TaxID=3702 RepID=A0A654FVM8_ARATH|nr:unnamed protein product [Arabidopsis thaliana]